MGDLPPFRENGVVIEDGLIVYGRKKIPVGQIASYERSKVARPNMHNLFSWSMFAIGALAVAGAVDSESVLAFIFALIFFGFGMLFRSKCKGAQSIYDFFIFTTSGERCELPYGDLEYIDRLESYIKRSLIVKVDSR